jgi:[ribosomal protein S5]-alanine N-acetyltransferase
MPQLESTRLLLRPPEAGDVADIAAGAGDFEIAKNLAKVPHPYSEDDARAFVARAADGFAKGEGYCFAILRKADGAFLGCCGVHLKDGHYELGYWIAKPFWKQGYASEAAKRLLGFAFRDLKAESVEAGWFHDNPASGRVLAKLGFKADHVEASECLARGYRVLCNRALLTRADFGRKKAAFDPSASSGLRAGETIPHAEPLIPSLSRDEA